MRRVLLSLVALGGLSLLAAPAMAADHSPFQLLGTPASITSTATGDHVAAPVQTVAYRGYYRGGYGYNRGYYGGGYNRGYYGGYYGRPYGSYYRGGYGGYPYGNYYRGGYGGYGYPGYYGRGIGVGFGFY